MVGVERKAIIRNQAIARFAKFVAEYLYNTDWTLVTKRCGITSILDSPEHERVRRAQYFGDSDYPDAIERFLQDVFDRDEQVGLLLVREIASSENPYDERLSLEARSELEQILALFGSQNADVRSLVRNLQPVEDYISVTSIPDDFYKRLIDEINHLYREQLVLALSVLIRKLLENLVIDILRKKYGASQLDLYYDPSRRRFLDFAVLVKNLDAKKADFDYVTPNLSKSIKDIERYRETGNASAHSLDINLTMEFFAKEKQRINYLVQLLIRTLQNI